ncbi:tetratricopeptide repeat protein [Methylibium sp.]|uniref:tetratricopeptide repeat protein n=1 Tax=Methylibium sp. TaxID=2067992 RepID=UPI003D0B81FE
MTALRFLRCLQAGWLLLGLSAQATALKPAGDNEIVETLPTLGAYVSEQRALRRQLSAQPRDAGTALALSRSLLERARHDGDARLAGQALGALRAWDDDAEPPAEIRLQRATLRQYLHDFDRAAGELEALLRGTPRQPQALLTLATVYRVQGRYADSDTACAHLHDAGQPLYAQACSAENLALRGDTDAARRRLEQLLAAQPGNPGWLSWIRTTLGELETRAGRPQAAILQFRAALEAQADDSYARIALVDVLIDAQRWAEAGALLGADASEAAMLRRAIVAQALHTGEAAALRRTVAERYAQAGLRPEAVAVHARERARFALEVEGAPQQALALARLNLQSQREAIDFVVMHRAARAAGDAGAQAEVAALARRIGLRDLRLELPAGSPS